MDTATPLTSPESMVFVAVELDAFILNQEVCSSAPMRVAPITQPDYAGLRIDSRSACHDALPRVDLSLSGHSSYNPRICNYGDGKVDSHRTGVHLSWRLPRCYRVGYSRAPPPGQQETGGQPPATAQIPNFPKVPNRWIVMRLLNWDGVSDYPEWMELNLFPVKVWIVESDRAWTIDELITSKTLDADLTMEVSPFIPGNPRTEQDKSELESALFLGQSMPWNEWAEDKKVRHLPLTNMSGSNPYFIDCAMHNINSLSFFDDLSYTDDQGIVRFLNSADCQYTVLGFHDSPSQDDPVSGINSVFGGPTKPDIDSITQRLHLMGVNTEFLKWNSSSGPSHGAVTTTCLGKIVNVDFNRHKAPKSIPANDFANAFKNEVLTEPVGIGATSLDALLALLTAHGDSLGSDADTKATVKHLLELQRLVWAADGDDYDSRVKADDLVQSHVYKNTPGEFTWHFNAKGDGSSAAPTEPTLPEQQYLYLLNDQQRLRAATLRHHHSIRWLLFAEFFKLVTNPDKETGTSSKPRVETLRKTLSDLTGSLEILSKSIRKVSQDVSLIRGVQSSPGSVFAQRKDPALCFAGLRIPDIASEANLPVAFTFDKIDEHFVSPIMGWDPDNDNEQRWNKISTSKMNSIPDKFADCLWQLTATPNGVLHPFFKKDWKSSQPWVPLFVEWEVEYFHIPRSWWTIKVASRADGTNHTHLHYEIKEQLSSDKTLPIDRRRILGRSQLTPQAGFNLRVLVEKILERENASKFKAKDPEEPSDPTLTQDHEGAFDINDDYQDFLSKIDALKFGSATLSGLTAHLLTRASGIHLKPNYRDSEGIVHALQSARAASAAANFELSDFEHIGNATAQTPYGKLAEFADDGPDPFKGVTHGQLIIRKLDFVDKFGQVVTAPVPSLLSEQPAGAPDHIHPCISDLLCPGRTKSHEWNTVIPCSEGRSEGTQPLCPFIQLPPSINQPARVNMAFVVPNTGPDNTTSSWRSISEWENPVWGWVIVNIADSAFQLYTGDGIFFVEVRFGGPKGIQAQPLWLPFEPSTTPLDYVSPKLLDLYGSMIGTEGAKFVRVFWDIICSAIQTTPYAPAEYATGTTAIIGKPLALVDAGFSLELADMPIEGQNTTGPIRTETEEETLYNQKFEYRIGDTARPFDGVVGYFDCASEKGSTDFSTIYAASDSKGESTDPPKVYDKNDPEHFPSFSPYWVDPLAIDPERSFTQRHDDMFFGKKGTNVKSLIIDPYTPIHTYTAILPTVSITLPRRIVQNVLSKMTAFYTAGPIALPKDVPNTYDEQAQVTTQSWKKVREQMLASEKEPLVRLPFKGKKGDWIWLQPYMLDTNTGAGSVAPAEQWKSRHYNAFEAGEDNTLLGELTAPPTLVEGFLQLARPLLQPDANLNKSPNETS